MSKCCDFYPDKPWYPNTRRYQKDLDGCLMQQGIRFTEVWQMNDFCTGSLIWYHTQTHLYYIKMIKWIIPWCQTFFKKLFTCSKSYSLFQKLFTCEKTYLLIRCYKTRFFLWNRIYTDRNGVNKTHTHTHTKQKEKDNTGKC